MTSLPQGPTASQLHARAEAVRKGRFHASGGTVRVLTEEEEPSAGQAAAAPTPRARATGNGSSSSANTWIAVCRCGREFKTSSSFEYARTLLSDCHGEGTIVGPHR